MDEVMIAPPYHMDDCSGVHGDGSSASALARVKMVVCVGVHERLSYLLTVTYC